MDVHPELDALRDRIALEDELGRPLVVQLDRPPNAGTQRLMDSLGVVVEVRPVSVAASAGQVALQRGSAAFDYRASRARIVRRTAAGETPVVCSGCGTEIDVDTPSHDPRCRYFDVGAPEEVKTEGIHTAAGALTAKEMQRRHQEHLDQQPSTTRCAHDGCGFYFEGTLVDCRDAFEAHRAAAHPNVKTSRGAADRELERVRAEAALRAQQRALRALDDGEALAEVDLTSDFPTSDEDDVDHDRPAEADADTTTTSVGDQDVEGADGAIPADSRVGEASTPKRQQRKKWTTEKALTALHAAVATLGRLPRTSECVEFDLPAPSTTHHLFGNWGGYMVAGGYPRPKRGPGDVYVDPETKQQIPAPDARATAAPPLEPVDAHRVIVADVGLEYSSIEVALAAADEIERDAERVAVDARANGAHESADRLIAEAHELADKVRAAAAALKDSSDERAVDPVPEEGPRSPTPAAGRADEEQPGMGARTQAATADGSGAAGYAQPAADPDSNVVTPLSKSEVATRDEGPPSLVDGDAAQIATVLRALADAIDTGLFRRTNLALIFDGLALEVRDRLERAA